MAYDLSPEADAAALKARRAELRAFSEEITEIVAQMPMPETYLEAERGARAVWVADRVLVRMRQEMLGDGEEAPSDWQAGGHASHLPRSAGEVNEAAPSEIEGGEGWSMPYLMTPVRLRLRNYADRLMEAAALIDKPTCYLDGERAQRYALAADRMLGQLYEPAKPARPVGNGRSGGEDDDYGAGAEPERPPYDDLEAWQKLLEAKLHKLAEERRQGRTPAAKAEIEAAFGGAEGAFSSHVSPSEGFGASESTAFASHGCREGPDEGLVPSGQVADVEKDGPAIRVVESIFAPSGPFGQRPCGCALSAPKCGGPCPIPP